MSVGYRLLRHHGAMYRAIASLLLHTAFPRRRDGSAAVGASRSASAASTGESAAAGKNLPPAAGPSASAAALAVERTIAPPAKSLVKRYIAWCGAEGRYAKDLPPHMVSQWGLPLVGKLLLQLPYRLTSVINQGVTLTVNGPLPRGVPLRVKASLQSVEEVAGRAKVVVAISTGTTQQDNLVEALLHMCFILPGKRPPKSEQARPPEPQWQNVGSWQADERDGLRFSLLTGDFNPIHWCSPLARRSVFKGKVLHGFGSLVRSYEALQPGVFNRIDVRFVKPVPLPSGPLQVELAPADATDSFPLRLTSAGGSVVHFIGHCNRAA